MVAEDTELSPRAGQAVWVTWFWHRRTQGICDRWGIRLVTVAKRGGGVFARLGQMLRTLRSFAVLRARVLIVQNPSLGLTLLAILCRPTFGYRLIVDAHNEAVHPYNRSGRFAVWLARRLLRAADLNIVTNGFLRDEVIGWGGKAAVLPDPLPIVERGSEAVAARGLPTALVIATHAPDEPTAAVIEAARALKGRVAIVMSGNPRAALQRFPMLGEVVRLTGFLPEGEYWRELAAADVVVDLTLMPDCLVCGAYEALAFARPLVLSGNRASRELFGDCAVFCDNSPESIAAAVSDAVAHCAEYAARTAAFRGEYEARWRRQAVSVLREIVDPQHLPEAA